MSQGQTANGKTAGDASVPLRVDAQGRLIIANNLIPDQFDYVGYTNTNATTDTYVYNIGGSGGTTIATVTIVYTDSTKSQPSTITRT